MSTFSFYSDMPMISYNILVKNDFHSDTLVNSSKQFILTCSVINMSLVANLFTCALVQCEHVLQMNAISP